MYSMAALRRITHPSLAAILDRAVSAADVVERGGPNRGELSVELYGTAQTLPDDHRVLLARRRPEAVIPFVGTAGNILAPLQLLGDVPCVRFYSMQMSGDLAQRLYGEETSALTTYEHLNAAPESILTPEVMDPRIVKARYIDMFLEKPEGPFPDREAPLVLISNATIRPSGYMEGNRVACEQILDVFAGLPPLRVTPGELPEIPDGHADWMIALMIMAALGHT